MTRKMFRQRWEKYFSSFTNEQLYAFHFLVSDMHKNGKWFEYVGKVTDAYVRLQQAKDVSPEKNEVKEVTQEQQAVH